LIIEVLNKVTGGKSGSDKLRTYVPEGASILVWYFFVFKQVPRRYAELLLSVYLHFAGTI
jgi:hypothetical protein